MELIQPYLDMIAQAVLLAVATVIITVVMEIKRRTVKLIESRTTQEQRDILQRLGKEAFAFAETAYRGYGGPAKLESAFDYVERKLETFGISIEEDDIRAAIEQAVLDYNAKTKPIVLTDEL